MCRKMNSACGSMWLGGDARRGSKPFSLHCHMPTRLGDWLLKYAKASAFLSLTTLSFFFKIPKRTREMSTSCPRKFLPHLQFFLGQYAGKTQTPLSLQLNKTMPQHLVEWGTSTGKGGNLIGLAEEAECCAAVSFTWSYKTSISFMTMANANLVAFRLPLSEIGCMGLPEEFDVVCLIDTILETFRTSP